MFTSLVIRCASTHCSFRTENTKLLVAILDDTDLKFAKWAVLSFTNWKNKARLNNKIIIEGARNVLMPPTNCVNSIVVEGGQHFMM
ncbi:MAG: hypothetical protein ACI9GM_000907 [Salibacteraceae bacterium]